MDILSMITGVDLTLFLNLLPILNELIQSGGPVWWLVASPFLLWLFYLALMAARRAELNGTLTPVARALGLPILLIGALLDVFCNLTVMTLVMMEPPRELLVTARLNRLVYDKGYRGAVARWMGKHLLDPFDPTGSHLKYEKAPDGSEPTLQM